ncbi:hypothetical protein GQ54DRAFT_299346 [Martensiomyces pterosporus]|nr:hypothetical protein GQ54DRAFT_299346 [Martensiomyces pterosporus]
MLRVPHSDQPFPPSNEPSQAQGAQSQATAGGSASEQPSPPSSAAAVTRPRRKSPPAHPSTAVSSSTARVDFDALAQWSGTGKVKRPRNRGHSHRRYRLGKWHSRSTSSWNPPSNAQPGDRDNDRRSSISKLREASQSRRSLVSVDISYKPSESRRSSIYSLHAPGGEHESDLSDGCASDLDDESNGPLTQMLLRENDEIWNNPKYRFTFYSPTTGTVRSTNVQSLCTDEAKGLDALIRQAMGGNDSTEPKDAVSESQPPPPQLSVTGAAPSGEEESGAASKHSDNGYLHPNDALDKGTRRKRNGTAQGHGQHPADPAADASSAPGDEDVAGQPPKLFWLDIMDPTDSEIMALSRIFDLHPLTTEELLLMKDEGTVQDNCKSFRHYDIICYRTSAISNAQGDAAGAENGLGFQQRTLVPAANEAAGKPKPFVREILGRVKTSDSSVEAEKQQFSTSKDYGAQKKQGVFASLGNRLRAMTKRPQVVQMAVPEINIPTSSRNSYSLDGAQERSSGTAGRNDEALRGLAQDVQDDVPDESVPFYTIVLPHGVITLHCRNLPHVRNTIARLLLDEDSIHLTPDYIAYLLLDDITDTLVPTTRLLELEVDAVDELVLILTRAEHDDVLKRIGIERRHALWLVRLLHGKAEVLRAIERRIHAKMTAASAGASPYRLPGSKRSRKERPARAGEGASTGDQANEYASDEDGDADDLESQLLTSDEEEGDIYGWSRKASRHPDEVLYDEQHQGSSSDSTSQTAQGQFLPDVTKYLADVQDHLVALTASVHHCERILARAHGNYLARINLELTHASNTTNQLATQMTVLAGIFLPLNLVAGIFGMNVKVPGRDRDDLRDFGLIIGAMVLFVAVALFICRWRRII